MPTGMVYYRTKYHTIKGVVYGPYWYKVGSYREGKKVKQRVLAYLGKSAPVRWDEVEEELREPDSNVSRGVEIFKNSTPFVVLDLETTGFSPVNNKIIEIAIGKYRVVDGVLEEGEIFMTKQGVDLDFNKEEKLLLEEYRVCLDTYHNLATTYANWESYYIITEGILIATVSQLLLSKIESLWISGLFISILGVIISFIWFLNISRSYRYCEAILKVGKKIENFFSKPSSKNKNFQIFQFTHDVDNYINNHAKRYERISSWSLRRLIPWIFIIIWVGICSVCIIRITFT